MYFFEMWVCIPDSCFLYLYIQLFIYVRSRLYCYVGNFWPVMLYLLSSKLSLMSSYYTFLLQVNKSYIITEIMHCLQVLEYKVRHLLQSSLWWKFIILHYRQSIVQIIILTVVIIAFSKKIWFRDFIFYNICKTKY